jgi:hypothetical protein
VKGLRFVQEYRGRRIVTNGTMFGIEGELITDCRYLSVAGARAAIDSEVVIAARRRGTERQRRDFAEYIAQEGKNRRFACDCGWHGGYNELEKTGTDAPLVRCPSCFSDGIMMAVGDAPDEPARSEEEGREEEVGPSADRGVANDGRHAPSRR